MESYEMRQIGHTKYCDKILQKQERMRCYMKVANSQLNCSVPFGFLGRYLIWEPGDIPLISVVVEHEGNLIFEIFKNKPNRNQLTKVIRSTPGIIIVSDKTSNKFIYKIRPSSETSIVFGTLSSGYITAAVSNEVIKVDANTFTTNMYQGFGVGIIVTEDGIGTGAPLPPHMKKLLKSNNVIPLHKPRNSKRSSINHSRNLLALR